MIADIFLAGVGERELHEPEESLYKNYEQMKHKADSHFPDDTEVRG